MPMTSKEMLKLLKRNHFTIIGCNGSHYKLKGPNGNIVILPMHNKDLKKGTEDNILKQAGLK